MVEAALNVAAEQVIEHDATGAVPTRDGQPRARRRAAGRVPGRGRRRVGGARRRRRRAVGGAGRRARRSDAGRRPRPGPRRRPADGPRPHRPVDLGRGCAGRDAEDAVERLQAAGVPAEVVVHPRDDLGQPAAAPPWAVRGRAPPPHRRPRAAHAAVPAVGRRPVAAPPLPHPRPAQRRDARPRSASVPTSSPP